MSEITSSGGSRRRAFGWALDLILPLCIAIAAALYIAEILSYDIVIEAFVDGEPVGYIESRDVMTGAVTVVENEIYEGVGEYCILGSRVTYGVAYAKEPEYLTSKDCRALVESAVADEYRVSNMLYVDGVMTAATDDADELRALIGGIGDELLESAGDGYDRVEVGNHLSIERQFCPIEYILGMDEINELLNPLCDDEPESEPVPEQTVRIGAFSALASLAPDEVSDPDVDYGLTRAVTFADVPEEAPALSYYLVSTETVDEVVLYETEYIDDPDSFVGTEKVLCEGSDGFRTVTYEIKSDISGRELMRSELSETIITPVVNKVVRVGSKPIPEAVPTGSFIWPCSAKEGISSGYGGRDLYGSYDFHLGIDLPGDNGDPIYASDGGEVVWAGFTPSYGNSVRILHDGELVTLYAHMQKLYVSAGDMVYQGQQIGEMGHTGAAYGTHLHFEVRTGTTTVNPIKYLPEMPEPEPEPEPENAVEAVQAAE